MKNTTCIHFNGQLKKNLPQNFRVAPHVIVMELNYMETKGTGKHMINTITSIFMIVFTVKTQIFYVTDIILKSAFWF